MVITMAKARKTILISCLGTTDPIRGEHDGPMLHIVRHYRPDYIMWLLSEEIAGYEKQDDRFNRALRQLLDSQPEYTPRLLEPYYFGDIDVSDFDVFYNTFKEQLDRLTRLYPDAEILLNTSSGTPQMKMALALFATDLRYRSRAVQVKNYERASGSTERTNAKDYDIEFELEFNEDDKPGAENRCIEPKLVDLRRTKQLERLNALLRRYDYSAVELMLDELPEKLKPLITHLARRSVYDYSAAVRAAGEFDGFELYPSSGKDKPSYRAYRELSEYVLMLKLMQRTERYTDFAIRLNPLTIRLQTAYLKSQGFDLSRVLVPSGGQREDIFSPERFREYDRELYDALSSEDIRLSDAPSIFILNKIIDCKGLAETETGELFKKLDRLNRSRNKCAHRLENLRDDDIKLDTGCTSVQLVKLLISLLAELFPEHYDERLYSIYDEANRWIMSAL